MKKEFKFFLTELTKTFVSKDKRIPGNLIFKYKDGFRLMYYDKENNVLYINYEDVWEVLEKKYNLEYEELQQLIQDVLLKKLNWKIKKVAFRYYTQAE